MVMNVMRATACDGAVRALGDRRKDSGPLRKMVAKLV
jgi:hypothetical protein